MCGYKDVPFGFMFGPNYVEDCGEKDCDLRPNCKEEALRCQQDIHECDCDSEYFYGHNVDYDLARDMERGK